MVKKRLVERSVVVGSGIEGVIWGRGHLEDMGTTLRITDGKHAEKTASTSESVEEDGQNNREVASTLTMLRELAERTVQAMTKVTGTDGDGSESEIMMLVVRVPSESSECIERMDVGAVAEACSNGSPLQQDLSSLPEPARLPATRGALDARRLRRIMRYIDAHIGEDLSVETLAREACLSTWHFARAFKAAMGMAPHEYITDRRFELARTLIAKNEISLAEVSALCGFSSQAYFTTWYKRIAGTTPGACRKNAPP